MQCPDDGEGHLLCWDESNGGPIFCSCQSGDGCNANTLGLGYSGTRKGYCTVCFWALQCHNAVCGACARMEGGLRLGWARGWVWG